MIGCLSLSTYSTPPAVIVDNYFCTTTEQCWSRPMAEYGEKLIVVLTKVPPDWRNAGDNTEILHQQQAYCLCNRGDKSRLSDLENILKH